MKFFALIAVASAMEEEPVEYGPACSKDTPCMDESLTCADVYDGLDDVDIMEDKENDNEYIPDAQYCQDCMAESRLYTDGVYFWCPQDYEEDDEDSSKTLLASAFAVVATLATIA